MVRLANAAGALTTEERGAIPALPQLEAIFALLK
jgi:sugar/nucleoside kinase (ribokinase family)